MFAICLVQKSFIHVFQSDSERQRGKFGFWGRKIQGLCNLTVTAFEHPRRHPRTCNLIGGESSQTPLLRISAEITRSRAEYDHFWVRGVCCTYRQGRGSSFFYSNFMDMNGGQGRAEGRLGSKIYHRLFGSYRPRGR